MGTIDSTDLHRQVANLDTRVSVIETHLEHADEQRDIMQHSLKDMGDGIKRMHTDLQHHVLQEARDRNKLLILVISTLLSVLGGIAMYWLNGQA